MELQVGLLMQTLSVPVRGVGVPGPQWYGHIADRPGSSHHAQGSAAEIGAPAVLVLAIDRPVLGAVAWNPWTRSGVTGKLPGRQPGLDLIWKTLSGSGIASQSAGRTTGPAGLTRVDRAADGRAHAVSRLVGHALECFCELIEVDAFEAAEQVAADAGVVHGLGLFQAGEPGIGQDGVEGAGVLGVLLAPDQAVGF